VLSHSPAVNSMKDIALLIQSPSFDRKLDQLTTTYKDLTDDIKVSLLISIPLIFSFSHHAIIAYEIHVLELNLEVKRHSN